MKRRWMLPLLAPVLALAEPVRPNVLFIVVDDLRTNLGCYGDAAALTPALDTLAARGTRFAAAYCQQAVCAPSRASLLTGRRPDTLRVWDLVTPFRRNLPDVVTLPQYFKQHGYHTAAIGKIFHDGKSMVDPVSWSEEAQLDDVPKREDYRHAANRREGGGGKAAPFEFADAPAGDYPDGRVADAAVRALAAFRRTNDREPFFLALGFRKPHLPFTAPKRYWDLYDGRVIPPPFPEKPPTGAPAVALHDSVELRGYSDLPQHGDFSAVQTAELRRAYYAATSFTDAQIGRVLEALRAEGLDRRTWIVVLSDHGYHLGEQGLWVKTTNYEADTRVPLIIVPPGGSAGGVTSALSELLDLYPTLVDVCGLPPAPGVEGRSLRPWLENPAAPGRASVQSQFPRPWLLRQAPRVMGYAVRTPTHRYIEWRDWVTGAVQARELYALAAPGDFEQQNVAAAPGQRAQVRQLAALLPAAVPHER
jgi:iduronate 2-sulfatase